MPKESVRLRKHVRNACERCRKQKLKEGMQRHVLQKNTEAVMSESFWDIISLATIESAQTCVLLSVYYLYRVNVQKAWPICGCALRIAQALELHRSTSADDLNGATRTQSYSSHAPETRKRCWWAIYEVETFCCMLYGYTPATCDADCSVDFLDDFLVPARLGPNLLTYKKLMSILSVIIKQVLQLINRRRAVQDQAGGKSSYLQSVIAEVQELHSNLEEWQSSLPHLLRSGTFMDAGYSSLDEAEHDIGASRERFARYAAQLQALTLKLAYDNTRILIHRRLLSFDFGPHLQGFTTTITDDANIFNSCLSTCREAASQTVEPRALPIFKFAAHTYAAAFIDTHLFTAGVALCLSAMIDPLSEQNTSVKRNVQQILKLQKGSRAEILPSSQSMSILQKLIRLVLEKELACILNPSTDHIVKTVNRGDATHQHEVPAANDQTTDELVAPGQAVPVAFDAAERSAIHAELPNALFDNLQGFEDAFSTFLSDPRDATNAGSDSISWDLGQAWMWSFDHT